jgi:hypothetical protein
MPESGRNVDAAAILFSMHRDRSMRSMRRAWSAAAFAIAAIACAPSGTPTAIFVDPDGATNADAAPEAKACDTNLAKACTEATLPCRDDLCAQLMVNPGDLWPFRELEGCGPLVAVEYAGGIDTSTTLYFDAATHALVAITTGIISSECYGPSSFRAPDRTACAPRSASADCPTDAGSGDAGDR